MDNIQVTVITPTTGKPSLFKLMESITNQNIPIKHILLWDDKREGCFGNNQTSPFVLEKPEWLEDFRYLVECHVIKGNSVKGQAFGSMLRSVGLMAATTEYVTFADDDVTWEDNHLSSMLEMMKNHEWGFCKRKIWSQTDKAQLEYLGVDEFESVGEEAKTPYKMVDNSSMIFKRKYGASAAILYRETEAYNDDRLMYDFLKTYGGSPGKTNLATVNQICPNRLNNFFKLNCTK
jgi:hypothetical protein